MTARKNAIKNNCKTYSTGKPCKHGHYSDRLVKNRTCIECLVSRTRQWRKNNFEHVKTYGAYYHKSNPEIKRISEANRNAKKKISTGKFTKEDIVNLYNSQLGLCAVCKCQLKDSGYHIDHKMPLSRGGSNWLENLQLLCPHDNVSKHTLTDSEYLQKLAA